MSYTVPTQPNTPHNDKKIIKNEQVMRETYLTISDLLKDYAFLVQEIMVHRKEANSIVDELVAINKVHRVDDIPTKL